MANNLNSNPIHLDTVGATSVWTGLKRVRLMQWVDTAGDIADTNELTFVLNGVTFTVKWQKPSDVGDHLPILNVAGPFNPGIPVNSFSLTTMTKGNMMIWVD